MFSFLRNTSHNRGASSIGVVLLLVILIGGVVFLTQRNSEGLPSFGAVLSAHSSVQSFDFAGSATTTVNIKPSAKDINAEVSKTQRFISQLASLGSSVGTSTEVAVTISTNGRVALATSSASAGSVQAVIRPNTASEDSRVLRSDWRAVGDQQVIRMQQLPIASDSVAKQLEGQWFQLPADQSVVQETLRLNLFSSTTPVSAGLLSSASMPEILRAMVSGGVLTIANVTKTELRNAEPAYQYNFKLNPQALSKSTDIFRSKVSSRDSSDSNEKLMRELTGMFKILKQRLHTARIWTDRKTNRLRRLLLVIAPESTPQSQSSIDLGTTTIDFTFSSYNRPVSISLPTNSQPIPVSSND